MPREETMSVVITAITQATAQVVRFASDPAWIRFQNDSPITITFLGMDGETLYHIIPGDILPFDLSGRDGNTYRLYGDVASAAVDVLAGNILYIHWVPKVKIR